MSTRITIDIPEEPGIARVLRTGDPTPEWKKVEPLLTCCECGQEIYGEEYYGISDKGYTCAGCMDEEWRGLPVQDRFDILGYTVGYLP